ncbi:MAG: Na/Pi symporter, partial [Cytophagales bacterium]|nr:Na/Pi symporter [Cytophagales bacterium]
RKAIAGGTVHDFFNILTVLLLFPLEFYYGLVSSSAQKITEFLIPSQSQDGVEDFGFALFDVIPLTNFLIKLIDNGLVSIILSFLLLFGSIKVLSRIITKILIGESQGKLREFIFSNPYKSFTWGAILTAAVQSSSITTSLVVPFVAKGKIRLQSATPFIMGANIGTTITAFIAVLIESSMAMGIAVTHLLFNLVGVIVFLPFRQLRNIPIKLAYNFGALTMNYRLVGISYILFTFFIIPFALIYFNKNASVAKELTYTLSSNTGTSQRKVLNIVTPDRRYGAPWSINPHSTSGSDDIFNIYRRNDVLFINNKIYLIKQKGFCWDDQEPLGKYSMCVEEILPHWGNGYFSFDSVYIFRKSYYQPIDPDSSYFRYFISIEDKMLVKTEKLNYQHDIEFIEELTDIQAQ